jgi:AraC family transcriptional regulator, regulatory protein of adaptative response / methylated-DNA-[protein]-cysteine methyltransferase
VQALQSGWSSADIENAAIVARACRLIEESEEVPSLKGLAQAANLSTSHFHRLFKSLTKDYAEAHRASRVRDRLAKGHSVTEAIYDAAFNSSGRFYEKSRNMLGMAPNAISRWRREDIRFAVGQSSLGAILVASSDKGVVSILIGDDPDELVRDLQDRFPNARLVGGDRGYESMIVRVVGFVETQQIGLNLPLDVRGAAFQRRVWQALQDRARKVPWMF